MTKTVLAALAGTSLFALAAPALAQDAQTPPTQPGASTPAEGSTDQAALPEPTTGDIVVTAQRRQERVVDVPISITVANQAQLERQQVNTVNDLNRIAPSLEIQAAPGQNTGGGGAIRGIGTQTFQQGAQASVGVVVDQVSQGNANISDLFDVARIEVLKGPQGTLFGLTTSAGVINITTNAPDPSAFTARVRTELSNAGTAGSKFGDQIVQGVLNFPLGADAALRVSGNLNLRQGPNRNALTDKYNKVDRYGGRARLLWTPTDALTFNLIGDYTHGRTTGGGDFFTFTSAGGAAILPLPTPFPVTDNITARLASCGVTAAEGNRTFCTTDVPTARDKAFGASFEADYDAGPFTLTSITAYRGTRSSGRGPASNIFRADPLILDITTGAAHNKTDLFTEEFRVSSPSKQFFEYTVGAFYSHQKTVVDPQAFNLTLHLAPGVNIPILRNLGARSDVLDESLAVFGQGTFHITPALRVIAGGRFTGERLQLLGTNLGTLFAGGADAYSYQRRYNTDVVSYRFGAQYDLGRSTMAYATASRGFKGGQIVLPTDPTVAPSVLLAEIPTDYEAGLKTTLFGGWVADLNVFYEKFRNFQAQQCLSNATTGSLNCSSTNIDGVKTRGGEINFFGKVTPNLSLNTGFIYTKATYPNGFLGTDGTAIGGSQLAYAPKYKFTLSGEYEQPLTGGLKGFLAADTVWKSRIRYEANSVRASTYRAHWTAGGRVGIRTEDDRYQLAVFARNLFNQHEPILYQSGFPYPVLAGAPPVANAGGNVGAIYGPQSFRQVGLSLDAKF